MMAVASQEFPETQRVTRMVGSDQHCIANGIGNEENAAQHKRVQEYLPERSISLHDVAQIGSIDFKECAGFYCPGANQRSTTREQVHVAGEFSATQNVENSFAIGSNAKHSTLPLSTTKMP